MQQILLRRPKYSVIATLNLNGDYISDARSRAGGRHRQHRASANISNSISHVRGHARYGLRLIARARTT